MKCDERKPACQKCSSTGRTCDGYESTFRPWTSNDEFKDGNPSRILATGSSGPVLNIRPKDVQVLQRCLSTKTLFDVHLDCDEEARELLEASLTNPAVRHAISSLKSLRRGLEDTTSLETDPAMASPQSSASNDGLEQYCVAMGVLASQMSSSKAPDRLLLRSAMFCCQIFISIEQTRGNFNVMAKHMLQGLNIMHHHRARPRLLASELLPAKHQDLPLLDVFIIKLFAAPCKFADRRPTAESCGLVVTSDEQDAMERQSGGNNVGQQLIAPDMWAVLRGIATSTLQFLDKTCNCASVAQALHLVDEKARLLRSLELWRHDLSSVEGKRKSSTCRPELLSVSFTRLFYQVLKLILMGSLDAAPTFYAEAHPAIEELRFTAEYVTAQVEVDRLERQAESGVDGNSRGMKQGR